MDTVRASTIFRSLDAHHPGVEVWPDPDAPVEGGAYFWVVSSFGEGNVRILAYDASAKVGAADKMAEFSASGDKRDLFTPYPAS